MNHPDTSAY